MGAFSEQNMLLAQQLKGSYSESGSFFMAVNGELDEDELKAIGDLLNNINNLAEDFYAGDIEQAFKEALELGFNSDEILRFSLNLRMDQSVKVQESYRQFSDKAVKQVAAQQDRMLLVARFIQILEKTRLEAHHHKIDDIAQLPDVARLHHGEKREGFVDFIKDMFARLEAFSSAKA